MDQLITPILEWLSTKHGSDHRATYGWVTVLIAACFIAKSFSAAEKKTNTNFLHRKIEKLLNSGPITAKIYHDNGQSKIQLIGHIKKEGQAYKFQEQQITTNETKMTHKYIATDLKGLEGYIKEKSHFVLSDFKPN